GSVQAYFPLMAPRPHNTLLSSPPPPSLSSGLATLSPPPPQGHCHYNGDVPFPSLPFREKAWN
ncbi:hypothetical protein IscW_ISCW005912, partial [Ixodes scapularis]